MDESTRLQQLLSTLFDTRNYLLKMIPTDLVAVAEVDAQIMSVTQRLQAELANPSAQQLTPAQVEAVQQAIDDLNACVEQDMAASQIVVALKDFIVAAQG